MKGIRSLLVILTSLILTFILTSCSSNLSEEKYSIKFIADGKTVYTAFYNDTNSIITVPKIPDKKGYVGNWETFTLDGTNKIVHALYCPIIYTVDYHVVSINDDSIIIDYFGDWNFYCSNNSVVANSSNVKEYTIESCDIAIPSLNNVEVKISEFHNIIIEGFYTDIACTKKFSGRIIKGSTGNITLYAKKVTDLLGPL